MKKIALLLGLTAVLGGAPAWAEDAQRLTDEAARQAERETGRSVSEQRRHIEQEAIEALQGTHAALAALDKGDTKAALEALAQVTGKLELLVARHPELGLIPVDVTIEQIDLVASEKEIEEAVEKAEDYLDDGEIQKARHLLQDLASELVIRRAHIPLASYPEAIKAVSPLIEKGELDAARDALVRALNTLVVTEEIVPLPVLRAQVLLRHAETLAEKADRSEEEQKRLEDLLDAAQAQIRYAEVLGYGDQDDYKPLYRQIDKIRKRVSGGRHGEGFFDRIREYLESLGEHSQKREDLLEQDD